MDKKYNTEDNSEEKMVDLEKNINDNKKQYRHSRLYDDDDVSQKSCVEMELAFLKSFFLILLILQATFILFFVLTYFKVDIIENLNYVYLENRT